MTFSQTDRNVAPIVGRPTPREGLAPVRAKSYVVSMDYLVTASDEDGSKVTLGPMSLKDALNEASNLASQGFVNPVIRRMNSSMEMDLGRFIRSLNRD